MIISDLHYLESVDTNVAGGSGKHYSFDFEHYFDYLEKHFADFADYLQTYKDDIDSKYKVYVKGDFKGKVKGVQVKAHSSTYSGNSYSVTWT